MRRHVQSRPTTFVPREIRTAIRQRLAWMDERVLYTVTMTEGDYLSREATPPLPWHWLVVTDRQLLLFQRAAEESEARTLLACPHSAILTVEVGSVLLLAWITVVSTREHPVHRERAGERCTGPKQYPNAQISTDEHCTQVRIQIPCPALPSVQAAIRDLIRTSPDLSAQRLQDDACRTNTYYLPDDLQPPFRSAVAAMTAQGESVRAVLYAPPGNAARRRKAAWLSREAEDQPWCGVTITDRRVLLLEQPPPLTHGGSRYGCMVTQVAPDAIRDVELLPTQTHAMGLQLRMQRGMAVRSFLVELDDRQEAHWSDGVAMLRATIQAAQLPLTGERRSFIATTGLHEIVLSDPSHYGLLLRQITEHQYYLGQHGRATALVEAACDWHASLYGPITAQLTARGVTTRFPNTTPADLYVRLCEYKWLASERLGIDIGFELALQALQYWVA